jgi:hypothetical protein
MRGKYILREDNLRNDVFVNEQAATASFCWVRGAAASRFLDEERTSVACEYLLERRVRRPLVDLTDVLSCACRLFSIEFVRLFFTTQTGVTGPTKSHET